MKGLASGRLRNCGHEGLKIRLFSVACPIKRFGSKVEFVVCNNAFASVLYIFHGVADNHKVNVTFDPMPSDFARFQSFAPLLEAL